MDSSPEETATVALSLASDTASAIQSVSGLWESALGRLPKADQAVLLGNEVTLKAVKDSLNQAEAAQSRLRNKQWKIKFHGKEHAVGTIWAKIIGWIKGFKNIVDKFITLDTSGKAALPWAAIKALEYQQDQVAAVTHGMATIIEVISYYAQFEPLYIQGNLGVVEHLRLAVVDVYSHILQYLALAQTFYDKRASLNPMEHVKSLAFTPSSFYSCLTSLEEDKKKVDLWANLVHRETDQDLLQKAKDMQAFLQSHDRRELLSWISVISSLSDHIEQRRLRLQGTGLWLLKAEKFQHWRQPSRSSLLWLKGSVGTGKTILASLVVDCFLRSFKPMEMSPVLYFYCRTDQNPEEVLRNLVQQIFLFSPETLGRLDKSRVGGPPLSAEECLDLISKFVKTQESVAIVVDSLDKWTGQGKNSFFYGRVNLFQDLAFIMNSSTTPVKLLVTSRGHDDKIDRAFQELPNCRKYCLSTDDDQPDDDIRQFIRYQVGSWGPAEFLASENDETVVANVKQHIIKTVTHKAGRMFVWAVHVLSWLRTSDQLRTVDDVLDGLKSGRVPDALKALYDQAYQTLYKPNVSNSSKAVSLAIELLFCSKKQLSAGSLFDAIRATGPGNGPQLHRMIELNDLVSNSRGFITYDQGMDIFRFQHPSVRQYLGDLAQYEFHAHRSMARACLASLCMETSRIGSFEDTGSSVEDERGRSLSRESTFTEPSWQDTVHQTSTSLPGSPSQSQPLSLAVSQYTVAPSLGEHEHSIRSSFTANAWAINTKKSHRQSLHRTASLSDKIPCNRNCTEFQDKETVSSRTPPYIAHIKSATSTPQRTPSIISNRCGMAKTSKHSSSNKRAKSPESKCETCHESGTGSLFQLALQNPFTTLLLAVGALGAKIVGILHPEAREPSPGPLLGSSETIDDTHHFKDEYISYASYSTFNGAYQGFYPERRSSTRPLSRLSSRSRSRPGSRAGYEGDLVLDRSGRSSTTSRKSSIQSVAHSLLSKGIRNMGTSAAMNGTIQDFQEYASLFWVSHYKSCGDLRSIDTSLQRSVEDLLVGLFVGDQPEKFDKWISNVEKLLSQQSFGFYNKIVERELEYCVSPPSTAVQVSCVYGLTNILERFCSEMQYADSDKLEPLSARSALPFSKNEDGMTGLHIACRFGRTETVQYLAKLTEAKAEFLVLDNDGKSVLHHAVETARETAVVKVLLKTGAERFRSESRVLVAAMRNPWCGEDLVKTLLCGPGISYKPHGNGEELIAAAMRCHFSTPELVRAVSAGTTISGSVLIASAQPSSRACTEWSKREKSWTWLIAQCPESREHHTQGWSNIIIEVLKAAVMAADLGLTKYILKTETPAITQTALTAAVANRLEPLKLIDMLFKYGRRTREINWTSVLVKTLWNPVVDQRLISIICSKINPSEDLAITESMLEPIAKNRESGEDLLKVLLKNSHEQDELIISLDTLEAAVANGNSAVVALLFEFFSVMPTVPWRFLLMFSVGSDEHFLSDQWEKYSTTARRDQMLEPETAESFWDQQLTDCLRLVLQHDGPSKNWIRQEMAEEAASRRGPRMMELLFDPSGTGNNERSLCVSKEMVLAAVRNTIYGHALLPLLEQRAANQELPIDNEVLQTAAAYGDLRTVVFLLGNQPLESYSREFAVAAAGNPDSAVVEFLFGRIGASGIRFAELEAAAANSDGALECLFRHLPLSSLQVFETAQLCRIIAEKCQRVKNLREALSRGQGVLSIRRADVVDLIVAAVKNRHGLDMASYMLKRQRHRIRITEDMLVSAAGNPTIAPEMLRLLLNECDDRSVERTITLKVLETAATNSRNAPEALRILLMELDEGRLSQVIEETSLGDAAKSNLFSANETLTVLNRFKSCASR